MPAKFASQVVENKWVVPAAASVTVRMTVESQPLGALKIWVNTPTLAGRQLVSKTWVGGVGKRETVR